MRVARTLDVAPWSFTVAVPAEGPSEDAFALDRTDRRYRSALAKLPDGAECERCIFLFRLGDGTARCGLGESRPATCRSYPVELHEGALRIADAGCSCGPWSLDDVDTDAVRSLLGAEANARAVYARAVAQWNAYVQATAGDEAFDYADYCRYLLDRYGLGA